jgi:hypothetical protein
MSSDPLVELLIDRMVVTDNEVEIRYIIPTQPDGPHVPSCHLRTDYQNILHELIRGLDLLDFMLYTIHQARDMRTSVNFSRLHPQDKFRVNPRMGRLGREDSAKCPNITSSQGGRAAFALTARGTGIRLLACGSLTIASG